MFGTARSEKVTVVSPGGLRPTVVTLPGPLVKLPATGEVTCTVIVQEVWPAARVPFVTAIDVPPAAAVVVALQDPPTVPPARVRPAGRVSVKPHPVFEASSLVLVTVKVRVE